MNSERLTSQQLHVSKEHRRAGGQTKASVTRPCRVVLIDIVEKLNRLTAGQQLSASQSTVNLSSTSASDVIVKGNYWKMLVLGLTEIDLYLTIFTILKFGNASPTDSFNSQVCDRHHQNIIVLEFHFSNSSFNKKIGIPMNKTLILNVIEASHSRLIKIWNYHLFCRSRQWFVSQSLTLLLVPITSLELFLYTIKFNMYDAKNLLHKSIPYNDARTGAEGYTLKLKMLKHFFVKIWSQGPL